MGHREAAMGLLDGDEPLWAPDLIFAEVGNAMWSRLRAVLAGAGAAEAAQATLRQILGRVLPAPDYVRGAAEIACELKHPVYDCIYLALCESKGLSLVTADDRLAAHVDGARHAELLKSWR